MVTLPPFLASIPILKESGIAPVLSGRNFGSVHELSRLQEKRLDFDPRFRLGASSECPALT